jgi:restriction endonuclease Mrr
MKRYRRPPKKAGLALLLFSAYYIYTNPLKASLIGAGLILLLILLKRKGNPLAKTNLNRCRNVQGMLKRYHDHPTQFEGFVAEIYRKQGYKARTTVATGDGGKDILMEKGNLRYAVEVKLYSPNNKIGRPLIQKLHSACVTENRHGIFVTTSSFTPEAMEYARRVGIQMVNGQELEKMIKSFS